MATNGNTNHQGSADQYTAPVTTEATSGGSNPNSNLSKDEVGWYFVEQYYTTLSKSPEKLHLFYGKRSQFVYGLEAEVANVSVGRQAIQERIKQLDFQDCKVRISNVDSQASFDNIVIQVIGETSNKSGEPKKFVQTFVLAQQPSGYFVLNDVLRYINEENDEEPVDPVAQDDGPVPEPEAAVEVTASTEAEPTKDDEPAQEKPLDPTVVDKKLEEATKEAPPSFTVDTPTEPAPAVEEPASKPETVDPEKAVQELAEEETKKPETPKDPSPTPVVTRVPAPSATEPEKPKEPAKPMTWASRAAAAAGTPRPVVPLPKTATPPAQPKPAAPAAAAPQTSTPAQAAEATTPSSKDSAGGEWQTAGADSKRQNRPQSISAPPPEKEGTMGYVKYVTEKVKADDLKAALASYGELIYFDINRSKNCAFVEFASTAGYQAAAAANPHVVNGENIVVEPRRPKASAYGGSNYNAGRGSISGRGRGGFEGGRSGSQGGGRGGFTGQGRGRGGGARGRGTSQAANA